MLSYVGVAFFYKANFEYNVLCNFSCLFTDDHVILQSRIT